MEEEEKEQEQEQDDETVMSSFRALLRRTISILRREDEMLEQQMIDTAIQDSMETYHNSLFVVDPDRKLGIHPTMKQDEKEETCQVCLDPMVMGDLIVALPCQHCFHPSCADGLVIHQHIACPLCRESIPVDVRQKNKIKEE